MRISKHSLFRLKITVGCRLCAYPSIHLFASRSRSVDRGAHIQAFTFLLVKGTLKITVGCPPCACPSTRAKTCARVGLLGLVCTETWRKLKTSRVATEHWVTHCAEITLCGHHLRPSHLPLKKKVFFFSESGSPGRTHSRTDTCLGRRAGHM